MGQFLEPDSLVIRKSDDQRNSLINQTKFVYQKMSLHFDHVAAVC